MTTTPPPDTHAQSETLEQIRLATGSLIDIVSEMAAAMEQREIAEKEWVELVLNVLREHKRKLRFEL